MSDGNTNRALRELVRAKTVSEREEIIQTLSVSHTMFNNWLEEKDWQLYNSKTKNKLKHMLLGN
jgi:hypothetical protein